MKTNDPRTPATSLGQVRCVLDVIVVTYNSWNSASSELTTMVGLAKEFEETRWTFVDNSLDGGDGRKLLEIASDFTNVRIFSRPDNPGFAGGCNMAARQSDSEWLFFLNPDITLHSWQLQRLIDEVLLMSTVDAVAISQVTHGVCHSGVGITKFMWFVDRLKESKLPLLGPSGGAGIYKRSIFARMGGFYEPLFAWGEDADLAMRLNKAGANCVEIDLKLEHQGQHSVSSGRGAHSFKARLLARNRIWIAERNLTRVRYIGFAFISAAVYSLQTPRNIARGTFLSTWRGYLDGFISLRHDAGPRQTENARDGH